MNVELIEKIIELHNPRIKRDLEIGQAEYAQRWARVQKRMGEKGYAIAYACGSELDRSDIAWLAGVFDPIIERYGILIPAQGKPVVLAGSEGGHVLEESVRASGARIALLREYQISDEDYRFAKFARLEDIVYSLVPYRPGKPVKVAILSSGQFIPYDHVTLFQGRFGADHVTFDLELLRQLKYEKSLSELSLCAVANRIADAAFLGMLAVLRPGVRELDVAAVADYIMKRLGAHRTGFPTIVSSGPRGRTVLGPATNRTIKGGEFVSLGLSPTFHGYHGIMRRTVKVEAPWTKEEERFMAALEGLYHAVMRATVETARKGLPSNFIDQQGKKYLEATKVRDKKGRPRTPREPYTFIHNTGCSECQEGYGAVTPYTENRLARNAALMIDVALMGFDEGGELVFPIEYAVIEDAFWKKGKEIGVYNRIPLRAQQLEGKELLDVPDRVINPYYKPYLKE